MDDKNIVNEQEQLLKEPLNFTDPFILHDSNIKRNLIPQIYQKQDSQFGREDDEGEYTIGTNQEYDSEYVSGILYPIVQINNRVINFSQIYVMTVFYDRFVPSIAITINDDNEDIQANDIPGFNNIIKVVIVPTVSNVYKTLYLEFKIIDCKIDHSRVTYYGEYNFIPFNKTHTQEIVYNGCNNQNCNSEQNDTPNTWELLHSIAIECGLGFSATDECKMIKDNLPRIISGERYDKFIPKQIGFGGLDQYSIFDCWVDLYGYLTLVNAAWVLEYAEVDPMNLSIKTFAGVHSTDYNSVKQTPIEVNRTLSNFNAPGANSNLRIKTYKTIVNNTPLLRGTGMHAMSLNLRDINNGNNSISQYDVEIKQNSIDGQKTEEYTVEQQNELFIECNELPINKQKVIRDKFFDKHRQRILEVELHEFNLGLQRGTLVNVAIFEDNPNHKRKILMAGSNYLQENEDPNPDQLEDEDNLNIVMKDNAQVLNPMLSGMYYIDYMRFEYTYEENEIIQVLGLIKRGNISGLDNKYTAAKISQNISK